MWKAGGREGMKGGRKPRGGPHRDEEGEVRHGARAKVTFVGGGGARGRRGWVNKYEGRKDAEGLLPRGLHKDEEGEVRLGA